MTIMYHQGNRQLQDQFDSRRIADRLEDKRTHTIFSADDKVLIESAIYFFVATANAEGRPDCSFKGGAPGFVHITGASELAFPDYDGNGMFKSLGNLLGESQRRTALHRHARPAGEIARQWHGPDEPRSHRSAPGDGQRLFIVRVTARAIFPNCPRYIPRMQLVEASKHIPQPGCDPPEPAWKSYNDFICPPPTDASEPSKVEARAVA